MTKRSAARTRLSGVGNRLACVALFLFLGMPVVAFGQEGNRDYYSSNPDDRGLLATTHKFHLGPGIADAQKGNVSGAVSNFEFILNYFPNDPDVLNRLSEVCTKRKVPKCDMEAWFQKALARNVDAPLTYVVLGIHLQRIGKPDLAVNALRKAVSLQPDSINAHYNLGLAYFELKDYEQANRHAQVSYALGAQVPGLKDKLVKVGKWKPLPPAPAPAGKPDAAPVTEAAPAPAPGTAK
jgi:tetratricopeptide (TPR) repeat protein